MARKPVSVFKRPSTKKGQLTYYIKLWDETSGKYTGPCAATAVALELNLDLKAFPSTSRTGAHLMGEELRTRGTSANHKRCELFADYCASIWDWDSSPYIQDKLNRGQRMATL